MQRHAASEGNDPLAHGVMTMIPTALVVEDDSVAREFIRLKLETSGWNVCEAQNATAALSLFRHQRPQLVTLDLIMPINDGFDAMHLARIINQEAPEVALLVVSAVGSKPTSKTLCANMTLSCSTNPPTTRR
jgi:CheY-like chemotaxis protein